ncbi:Wzz/FepE/Etk N-terminal domain-containing protein [Calditrichota bacterium LG25]
MEKKLNKIENKTVNYITIFDFITTFFKHYKVIKKVFIIFLILGIIYAIIIPNKYKSSSMVVAEINTNEVFNTVNRFNVLKDLGFNFGNTSATSLSPDAYPKIIKSRDVLLPVIHDRFKITGKDSTRLMDYLIDKNFYYYLKKVTIKLPITIYKLIFPRKKNIKFDDNNNSILILDKDEEYAINILRKKVLAVRIDEETGLIIVDVETKEPALSAQVNKAILESFRKKIQKIYDQKNNENLKFIALQIATAEQDLNQAEQRIIDFVEKNSSPQTITLQLELERLKREVALRTNILNELQLQYALTKIDLKKKEPVVRIVSTPFVPINPSGMNKIILIILFGFMGILIGIVYSVFKLIIEVYSDDPINKKKIEEIKQYFSLHWKKKKIE